MAGLTYEELIAQGAKPVQQSLRIPGFQQPSTEPGIGSRIGADYMRRGKDVLSDIQRPAELASQGASPWKVGMAVGEAGLRTVGNVIGAAFDPIAEAIAPVVKPVIEKIAQIPGVAGGVQAASDWATKHPDAAKDLGAVFNIATLPLGGAAEVGAKGALESTARMAGKVASPAGKALKTAGRSAYGLTVPMEEGTSKALLGYEAKQGSLLNRIRGELTGTGVGTKPITEADTAARMGLVGTEREIGIQAKQFQTQLWDTNLAPKLGAVKKATNMRQFFSELEDQIVKDTPELARKSELLEGLEALKSDYKSVGDVGGLKLQEYKSGWAENLPQKAWKGKDIAGSYNQVKKLAASKARGILYEVLGPESKMNYIDYGNLQSVVDAAVKAPTGDAAKRSFGRNVWEAVMDKAVTPVATAAGKVLYRTGEGLEFIGDIGAKKVGDIIQGSPNMLEAGANLTKDMPMGLSVKKVKVADQFDESIKRVMKDVQTSDPELWMVADDYLREPTLANKQLAIEEFKLKGIDLAEPTTQFTPDQAKLPNLKGKKANPTMGEIDPLLSEARKYKTAEEFVKAHQQSHLMDLSNYEAHRWGRAFPDAEYGANESIANFVSGKSELGSLGTLKYDNPEVYKIVTSPKDTVTVYRAVPNTAPDKVQVGDYVALTDRYAKMHLRSVLEGEQQTAGKVIKMEVPKTDVLWGTADYNEWVYSPQKLREQFPNGLTDIWNKANK